MNFAFIALLLAQWGLHSSNFFPTVQKTNEKTYVNNQKQDQENTIPLPTIVPQTLKYSLNSDTNKPLAYLALFVDATITDATCGRANGCIDLTVNGGTPPYTYTWSNFAITQDINSLNPGTYTVFIEDAVGTKDTLDYVIAVNAGPSTKSANSLSISGEYKKWHTLTFDFDGPFSTETCTPSPFLDYRLIVEFTHANDTFRVPGFFAADGNSAETSAGEGSIWRCKFVPNHEGVWTYTASFQYGPGLAIAADHVQGDSIAFDGLNGTFAIGPTDKTGVDLRGKGRLSYVNKRYLQFQETGEYFLKAGADSPENFLATEDFDNTPNWKNYRKSWAAHVQDWNPGDPVWQGTKGKGIIGAINYLSSKGMNAISFISMNIWGDDRNVFPYLEYARDPSPNLGRQRFDVSKLEQWDIVFTHAEQKGMNLQFKTLENENVLLLDSGLLGTERKLYYRELIARFGHHLAVTWNLGEENDIHLELNDPDQEIMKSYIEYIYHLDPYRSHIVFQNIPGQEQAVFGPLRGNASQMTGASLQAFYYYCHTNTLRLIDSAEANGKSWVIANDEQGGANYGVPPDAGYQGYVPAPTHRTQEQIRKRTVWGHYMAGGAGLEFYFGYDLPQTDLTCQDWRSRDSMWEVTSYAQNFFTQYLPFYEMHSQDELISNGFAFVKDNSTYVFYIEDASIPTTVTLPDTTFDFYWFNPRTGGSLQSYSYILGGPNYSLTPPTTQAGEDWVAFFQVNSLPSTPIVVTPISDQQHVEGETLSLQVQATGGDSTLTYDISGLPPGLSLDSLGNISGQIPLGAALNSPYEVSISVDDSDINPLDVQSINFSWNIIDSSMLKIVYEGEAECRSYAENWTLVEDSTVSEAAYLISPSGINYAIAPTDSGNILRLSFNLDLAAPYYIYARTQANTSLNNSYWIRVNGGNWVKWDSIAQDTSWYWLAISYPNADSQVQVFDMINGTNTLEIGAGADGLALDKLIVKLSDQHPVGFGGISENCTPQIPIVLSSISHQSTEIGLSVNLQANASGGNGPLSYTAIGLPDGLNIDPSSGTISGTIDTSAVEDSAYTVIITVDDDDFYTTDAQSISFSWTPLAPGSGLAAFWGEAECAVVGANWTPQTDAAASAGQFLQASSGSTLNNPPTNPADILTFSFNLAQAGPYNIHARVKAPTSQDDSFWVRANNGTWIKWNQVQPSTDWTWDQVHDNANGNQLVSFNLLAGANVIEFGLREDGISLDKIFVGPATQTPNALGGTASNCSGEIPINLSTILDQTHDEGENINLQIQASGGDNDLVYSATGLPTGLSIHTATGLISGTIAAGAALNSPYTVNAFVDDDDGTNTDVQNLNFTWTVNEPNPSISLGAISDQNNLEGDSPALFVNASGGDGALVYSASNLPTGLSINANTGEINGTISAGAAANSPYNVSVSVDDSDIDNTDIQSTSFTWTVSIPNTPILPDAIANQNNQEGEVISLVVTASGGDGALVYSASNLPTGLSINASTGEISGSIAAGAAVNSPFNVSVSVDDSDADNLDIQTIGFTWIVTEQGAGPEEVWLEAECATVGANWTKLSDPNASGASYVIPPNGTSHNNAPTNPANHVRFTFSLNQGGLYKVFARVITPSSVDDSFWIRANNGTWVKWNNIDQSNAWIWDQTHDFSNGNQLVSFNMNPGINTIDIAHREDGISLDKIHITTATQTPVGVGGASSNCSLGDVPIVLNGISDQNSQEGDTPNVSVAASGGDGALVYNASNLPTGLSINASTGVISGSISAGAAVGSPFNVTITVDDSDVDNTDIQSTSFQWTVILPTSEIILSGIPNQSHEEWESPSIFVNASGGDGALVYAAGNLPAGLNINSNTGEISGTISPGATASSPFTVNITVDDSDADNTDIQSTSFTWTVSIPNTPILPDAIANQNHLEGEVISLLVTASGGDGALIYSASNLPTGLNINANTGEISGTIAAGAATNSPFNVSVSVDDSDADNLDIQTVGFTWIVTEPGAGPEELWLEAECANVGANWTELSDPNASGASYVIPPNGTSHNNAPTNPADHIRFTFNLTQGGLYNVFARVITPSSVDDSFWIRANNGTWIKWNQIDQSNAWIWDQTHDFSNGNQLVSFNMNPGINTIDIAHREDGISLDKIHITTATQTPVGAGGASSNCTIADGPIVLNAISDQSSQERDTPNLSVNASGGDGALIYSASNLPAGLSINASTGVISGNISAGAAASSPYTVNITVDDSDVDNTDVQSTSFQWTISIPNTPILVDAISNQNNQEGDNPNISIVASGGDGALVYGASNLPSGLAISPTTGLISGTISPGASASSPYSVSIFVDDSDTDGTDIESVNFTWTVLEPGSIAEFWGEAECSDIGVNWTQQNDGAASGGAFLIPPSGGSIGSAPNDPGDIITFTFTLNQGGTYNIFGRVKAPSSSDDSFWVRANGATWIKWNNIQSSSSWIWDQVHDADNGNQLVSFSMLSGTNTVEIAQREDGVSLDKIYVTTDSQTPTGLGDNSSNCYNNIIPLSAPSNASGSEIANALILPKVSVYPSPLEHSQVLTLAFDRPIPQDLKIQLYDMAGRKVAKSQVVEKRRKEQKIELLLNHLPSGIYQIIMQVNEFQGVKRIQVRSLD